MPRDIIDGSAYDVKDITENIYQIHVTFEARLDLELKMEIAWNCLQLPGYPRIEVIL